MNSFDFEFQIKTKIKFGRSKIKEINSTLNSLRAKNLMVVVDNGIIEAGIFAEIEKELKNANINYLVFDKVKPDPTIKIVNSGVECVLENNIDTLLAVGGGSPIDTAKAVAASFFDADLKKEISVDRLKLLTIPTTSGSGSEVTTAVVITDQENKKKFALIDENLAPDVAIVDPELTKSLPAFLTAVGGMDALSHNIEAYVSQDAVLPFEMIATKGIEMVKDYLRPAVGNGSNMAAREGMALASLFGGIALTNCGLGLVHAISHPLGGNFNIPHGLSNTILLPYVMKFNLIANPKKYANIARIFGINIEQYTEMEAAYKAVEEVQKLIKDIGISESLRDFKVDKFEYIAELALEEKAMLKSNPRPVHKSDIIAILKDAY
ncbi:iron-containing alcohol dehydrogenase [Halanaerobium sp. Z-7514]|uniref:Iron-containing alcohol dehydrogenase n=1 Tax=Halanaerobium polyolivorans TaxID=2886943 RepID=A0AAW4WUE7_9FIRM|nr:iron-containing alcohol dehydrogenase [Halanaerobium polyolivorans]MCC3144155.1 iron-containing alcohol dehydrogenase [Halanaerobium polyolivorans]RQD77013.1 MAG: iron-containing alcohol dehydrogenase [Halanaerobium sp. MSAO_Bac5]